jgi:hypothetical protein
MLYFLAFIESLCGSGEDTQVFGEDKEEEEFERKDI